MDLPDKHVALYYRAEEAWMQLMQLRELVNSHPECLPLNVGTETELRRVMAEASHLLQRSEEAARVPGLRAAE